MRPDTPPARPAAPVMVRYRFSELTLSPQRRLLVRQGQEVPLIPRYFDLLLLLIERRREAVHRREIFDEVWGDVIVSDSALSQAVRTVRSALGDDSRDPRFIRTVSRHGYRFVFPDVIEEADDAAWPAEAVASAAYAGNACAGDADAPAPALRASASLASASPPMAAPAATPMVVDPLWPPLSRPWRSAVRAAGGRWGGATIGGALAGGVAGGAGGLILAAAPGSAAPIAMAPVLAVIGAGCGALGGAGVGIGLALAEASAGSRAPRYRMLAQTIAGALGGGIVGAAVQWITRWSLASLVGLDVAVGGGLEGVVIGAGAALGFAIATGRTPDGESVPRGRTRLRAVLVIAAACGLAALALSLAGRPLAGGTIHAIAAAASGSRATLAPLGRLIGEPDFGPLSRAILAFGEGAVFGVGLACGLLPSRR